MKINEPIESKRRLSIGAEVVASHGVHFRVWAPKQSAVDVVIGARGEKKFPLQSEKNGYFSGLVAEARAGDLYRFRLNGGDFPDPASRFQPEGPFGPSQVIDNNHFKWKNNDWRGVKLRGQVIYELHVGTFTREGNWAAAIEKLPQLAEVGITVIEVMPVADFPGKFGWGYDGVNMFAPTRLYGSPDDFRQFIDTAHGLKMGVILDVVYNHIGPDGNFLKEFSDSYFSKKHITEWGEAINFDGEDAGPVREFFSQNARYWMDEYRLDGLRLDATQQIFDSSPRHILAEVNEQARLGAGDRDIFIVAENERQEARLARSVEKNGYGLDGIWNDDFHHSARVALTARREAYYTDYNGTAQELLSAIKWGFIYQGQRYKWQKARRGHAALDLLPEQFITFLENHDQVSNSAFGLRPGRISSAARLRALTGLWLLSPGTPMFFQGQEFASTTPFHYFADHNPELAILVRNGRAEFMKQFPSTALADVQAQLSDPALQKTFEECKLDWEERERHRKVLQMHSDLLKLRRTDPAFSAQSRQSFDGAILSTNALLLRFFQPGADRLLIVNLGGPLHFDPAPEPLLAPLEGTNWGILWSSESLGYGGAGMPEPDTEENWRIPGEAAVLLGPITPVEKPVW